MIATSGHSAALSAVGRPLDAITGVRATVVDDHVYLSTAAGGEVDLADAVRDADARAARWAVAEVSSEDQAGLARWQRLGFVIHHRVRHLAPGADAAISGRPSPPA